MRKTTLVIIATIIFPFSQHAQYYYYNHRYYESALLIEAGGSYGGMNCITDLGGGKGKGKYFGSDINWKNSRGTAGFYILGLYQNKIGLRVEINSGEITASDSLLKKIQPFVHGRYERHLSFTSKLLEIQLATEVYPSLFFHNKEYNTGLFSPYGLIGLGFYSFEPTAKLGDRWYSLQPLRTEGQGFTEYSDRLPYKLQQLNISMGAGIKYEINAWLNTRLELNYRFLFTDYLDDVSTTYIDPKLFYKYLPVNQAMIAGLLNNRKQELNPADVTPTGGQRGNPENNDAFFSILLKAGITFGRQRR